MEPNSTSKVIGEVRRHRLTYLSGEKLGLITAFASAADQRTAETSIFLEAGCGMGGSALLLAHLKGPRRQLAIYDTFDGIPEPGDLDGPDALQRFEVIQSGESNGIQGDTYYGYRDDLLGEVKESFARFGHDPDSSMIDFFKGDLRDLLANTGPPIAFAHLDVDWYEPTMHALESCWPRLEEAGTIVVDDFEHWSGCRSAVLDFCATDPTVDLIVTGLGSAALRRRC